MLLYVLAAWFFSVVPWFAAGAPSSADFAPFEGTYADIKGRTPSQRPFRKNIVDLQNDGPSWDLFIQALAALQNAADSDVYSYYQLAGIHGRPYTSWNGVLQAQGAQTTGYCPHGSVLFCTWHRPYLALFEQILLSHAQTIANQYPAASQPTYQASLSQLRLPYWDWAAQKPTIMPTVVTEAQIWINTPSGAQYINNPLYTYNFHSLPLDPKYFPPTDKSDGYLAADNQTVRSPIAAAYLAYEPFMQQTYDALMKPPNFDSFCTTAASGPSIEAVHNLIHACIGASTGHMAMISYSAFDPIFWLHHVNVDRIFALYQAMNPSAVLTSMSEGYGTFTIPHGTVSTNTTSLTPFIQGGTGTWYTSLSSWGTASFGYTYPEVVDWNQDPVTLSQNVTGIVNSLYNPGGVNSKRMPKMDGQSETQWSVDLKVSKMDLGGERFVVRVFLGKEPDDSDASEWYKDAGYMGSVTVLGGHMGSDSGGKMVAYSEVSLKKGLKDAGVDGGDVNVTLKYLNSNLHWKAQKFDGTVIPVEQLKGLVVKVQSEAVTLPSTVTEKPKYGKKSLHSSVTKGRAGGWAGEAGVAIP